MKKQISSVVVLACVLFARPSLAGPFVWVEDAATDAGNLPGTADVTIGSGPLGVVVGDLDDGLDVDMYLIRITQPLLFSALTTEGALFVTDPQLFLFDAAGLAVYMNDDGDGLGSQSALPPGDPFGPAAKGLYLLAISWFDNEPFSALGRMFIDGIGTNGPDAGGVSPVISWDENVLSRPDLPTGYAIELRGASFAVPEPGALGLLALAALGAFGRRRLTRPARGRRAHPAMQ